MATKSDYNYYVKYLTKGPCSVVFTKKDGEVRTMECTRDMSLVPKDKLPKGDVAETNFDIVKAFDTVLSEWRSFRVDSVNEFYTYE